jgi:uncharacterized protein YeeX (DUF496 family)
MEHIWEILGYIVPTLIGTGAGWLFGRRKYNAEVDGTRVQNFDAAIAAYKKMYEDMIDDLKTQNGELKEEVENLKQELSENRKQIITLTNFVLARAMQNGSNVNSNFEDLKEIIK